MFSSSKTKLYFEDGELIQFDDFLDRGQPIKKALGKRKLVLGLMSNTKGGMLGYFAIGYAQLRFTQHCVVYSDAPKT